MGFRKFTICPTVLSLVAGSLALLPSPAGADTNPATSTMSVACSAQPSLTIGTQAGVPAVVPGETVTLTSTATFSEGTVYQAALTRPDGSHYFASTLSVVPDSTAAFTPDASALRLTQDGNPVPLVNGVLPQVGAFVLDTTAPAGTFRVYFPGDAAEMLANPQGYGLASFAVGSGGTTLALAVSGVVNDVPASVSGLVIPVGKCQQSVSSGPSNRSEQEQFASVAITEPSIAISKSTSTPAVAPGGLAHWSVNATSSARTDAGVLVAPAREVHIVDTLPAELLPVDDSGNVLVDGGATSSGGVWSSAARTLTWTIPTFAAGTSQTFRYSTRVDASLNPLDASVLANNATTSFSSLPAADGGGRSYTTSPATANITVGIAPPEIAKSANPSRVGFGTEITYTLNITIPASTGTDYSATITDVLPPGLTFGSVTSTVCTTGCPGTDAAPLTLPPYTSGTGETTWGVYLGNLEPSTDRVYEVTYTATTLPAANADIDYGDTLTNRAAVSFDAADRLGGAVPNTAALPLWDVTRTDTADITFDRPTLTITKSLITTPNPWDPNANDVVFRIDVENTSAMDAHNIQIQDLQPSGWGLNWGGVMADGGATFSVWTDYPNILGNLDLVPAGAVIHIIIPMSFTAAERGGLPVEFVNSARINEFADQFGNVIDARPGSPYEIPPSIAVFTPLVPHLTIDKAVAAVVATGSTVTYTVTVTNDSDATAANVTVNDLLDPSASTEWTYVYGSASGGGVTELGGFGSNMQFGLPPIAPHTSVQFTYQMLAPSVPAVNQMNRADADWTDGSGRWGYSLCTAFTCTITDFAASAQATTDVVAPQMTLTKGPDEDSFVPDGGTTVFVVDVANPGSVPLTNVVISDTMPATLHYESHSATQTGPAFSLSVDASDPANPTFTIPTLPPGSAVRLLITVRQDGTVPPGTGPDRFELVNEAAVVATEIPTPISDTGSTLYVPNILRPTVTKSVTPAVGKPGDIATWSVTIDVPANPVDVYDETVIDRVPDGLGSITPVGVTCNAGPCPIVDDLPISTPPLMPVTGDRNSYMGWWFGDVPAGTAFNLTFTYTTMVESALDDGTLVLDGQATEPLDNRVRGYYNTADLYGAAGDVPGFVRAPNSHWNGRTIIATAQIDIVSPNVTIEKTLTSHEKWNWVNAVSDPYSTYAASAGDLLTYKLRVCNIGSSDAYDVIISDDMGGGDLRGVSLDAGPATVTDGWTPADPTVQWTFGTLATGDCADITYSGTTWDSANLLPEYSGLSSDVAAITNTATVQEWHTVPGAGIGDIVYGPRAAAPVVTLIMTPFALVRGTCQKVLPGTTARFGVRYWTYSLIDAQWTPYTADGLDPTVGGMHDARLEMWLAPGLEYVPGSARASGRHMGSSTPAAFRDPDSISTAPDGRTLLVWNEDYLEYWISGDLNVSLELSVEVLNVSASATADIPVGGRLEGNDGNGSPSRGTALDAEYVYANENYGCSGRDIRISKRPDGSAPDFDKWKFYQDEAFDYFGKWWASDSSDLEGRGLISTSAVITDTLPDGVGGYVPGTAEFTLYLMDGTTTTFTAASISETITPLPGGRTRIVWTSWPVEHFRGEYRIPNVSVPLTRPDLIGATLTNDIRITDPVEWAGAVNGACGLPAAAHCDVSAIKVLGPEQVILDKVVDDPTPHEWGTTRTWTVTATVKAGTELHEFTVIDRQNYGVGWSAFDAFANASYVSASCVGCPVTDPPITLLPRMAHGNGHAMGWAMGDLAMHGADRVYTFQYTTTSSPLSDAPTGYAEDEANKITRHENEVTSRWTNADVTPGFEVTAMGASWWYAIHGGGLVCTFGGGCDSTDPVIAAIQLGFPWLSVSKECVSTDSNMFEFGVPSPEYGDAIHAVPPQNLSGQPNLTCRLKLANTGGAPAVNFAVRDTPDPVGDTFDNPADWPNNPTAVQWEVLTASGPFPMSTTWNDSGNSFVEWTAGPADPLDPGDQWDFELTMHADGWSADPGIDTNYGKNDATLTAWTDEFGNPIGAPATRSDFARFVRPSLVMQKGVWVAPDKTVADGFEPWELSYKLRQPMSGSAGGVPGATQSVALLATYRNVEQLASMAMTDELPAHLHYVPGSARLVHLSSLDPDFVTAPSMSTIPIPDPARSTASVSADVCAPMPRGETLTWNFSQTASDWRRAPWDSALRYATYSAFGPIGAPSDEMSVLVVFDVTVGSEYDACDVKVAGNANLGNTTAVAQNNDPLSSDANASTVWMRPLGIEKTPDAGAVIAGQTTGFDVSVSDNEFIMNGDNDDIMLYLCAPPYTDPALCGPMSAPWRSPYSPGFDLPTHAAVVTDVFTDYGLLDSTPDPITVEVVPPVPTGIAPTALTLGTDYTQTITRLDPDHVQITWEISKMPLPAMVLDSGTFQYIGPSSASVRIHIPVRVPEATAPDALPNGTVLSNEARFRLAVQDDSVGWKWPTAPVEVTDTGAIRVVVPSPPPTPIKTATPAQAVGGAIDYSIETRLPASQAWFDLATTDDMPAGTEFLSTVNVACEYAGGGSCDTIPQLVAAPSVQADGSTRLGWWFGDVMSDDRDRIVTINFRARLAEDAAHAAPLTPGDVVTNTVRGYSNNDDRIDDGTAPTIAIVSGDYQSSATATTTVIQPELTITKAVAQAGPLSPGDTVSWTVTVHNGGDATAFGTQVKDTPNAAVANVVEAPSSGFLSKGWTPSAPQLEWFIPSIPAGDDVILSYQAVVGPDAINDGFVTADNTADIVRYRTQPVGTPKLRTLDGPDAAASVPLAAASMAVSKWSGGCGASTDLATVIGKAMTFCVRVSNEGSRDAVAVDLRDVLPANWSYVNGTGAPGEPDSIVGTDPQILEWHLGDIAQGSFVEVTYQAVPNEGASLSAKNVALVTSEMPSGARSKNGTPGYSAETDTGISILSAGLEIAKLPDFQRHGFLPTGGAVPFTIEVGANTSTDLNGSIVTDTLPAPLTYTPGTATSTCAAFTEVSVTPVATGTAIVWSIDLPAGTSCTITLPTHHPGGRSDVHRVLNHVEAVNVLVPFVANQALAEFYGTATLGDHVWNDENRNGIQDAGEPGVAGVTVTLYNSAGAVAGTTTTDSSGNYLFTGLEPGEYRVKFTNLPEGMSFTQRHVGAGEADSDADPTTGLTQSVVLNSGDVYLHLDAGVTLPEADVVVVKRATSTAITAAGGTATYAIDVSNAGPGQVQAPIVVTDMMPAGMTATVVTAPSGWTCVTQDQTVTCTRAAALPAGFAETIQVNTSISAALAATGAIVNTVAATVQGVDATNSNNTSTATVTSDGPITPTTPAAPPSGALPRTGLDAQTLWSIAILAITGGVFSSAFGGMARRRRRLHIR